MRNPLARAAGTALLAAARAASKLGRALRLQAHARPLAPHERALLEHVFREGLPLDTIRIVEGPAGILKLRGRSFALGETIHLQRVDTRTRPDVLVHEAVHVWQYRAQGARYLADALAAQLAHGPRAYRWEEEPARGRPRWRDMNPEAQAQLVQDAYRAGALDAHDATCRDENTRRLIQEALAALRRPPDGTRRSNR